MCQPMVAFRFTLCNCRQILDFSELIIPYFQSKVNLPAPWRVPRLIRYGGTRRKIPSAEWHSVDVRKRMVQAQRGLVREAEEKGKSRGDRAVEVLYGNFSIMNIRSLAAYEQARRALRGVCEPGDFVDG